MTRAEIVLAVRNSWAETVIAQAFRRACGITLERVDRDQPPDDDPDPYYVRLMRQRVGALDR